MRIAEDYPPNFDEIAARFPEAKRKGVIFSFGDTIYNPSGIFISRALFAHETMHGLRQGDDVTGWWRRYMDDGAFRLAEEIPAHQAEYRFAMLDAPNRNERRWMEKAIAARLAGPMYGRMIGGAEARRIIKVGANG